MKGIIMLRKTGSFVIFFLIVLAFPVLSQQFSSKTLSLETLRYDLDVKVDYATKKILGRCRLTVHNPTDQPISHVPLLLYRLLKITAITDEQGMAIPYRQEVISFEDWEEIQVNCAEASLSKPLGSSQSITLDIDYHGFLFGYSNDGWMYVKDHIDKEFTFIRWDGFSYPVVG